jgi:hypothetical protein
MSYCINKEIIQILLPDSSLIWKEELGAEVNSAPYFT